MNTPLKSKINWTQIVGVVAQIAAWYGLDLPPEQQVEVAIGLAGAQSAITIIWRTFFTGRAAA